MKMPRWLTDRGDVINYDDRKFTIRGNELVDKATGRGVRGKVYIPQQEMIKGLKIDVSRSPIEEELESKLEAYRLMAKDQKQELERYRQQNEQRIKDQLSRELPDVKSPPPGRTPLNAPPRAGQFESYFEMINSLYDSMESGNAEAEKKIQQLWMKIPHTLKQMQLEGFSISECPRCATGVLEGTEKCPSCDFSLSEFARRGGELW